MIKLAMEVTYRSINTDEYTYNMNESCDNKSCTHKLPNNSEHFQTFLACFHTFLLPNMIQPEILHLINFSFIIDILLLFLIYKLL